MGFGEWLCDIWNEPPKEIEKEDEIKVLQEKKEHLFRPLRFDDYIGQERAKNILKSFIEGTRKRNMPMPHILLNGGAGCGKTTLARIIANEIDQPISEKISAGYSVPQLLCDLGEVQTEEKNGVIFLDEVHGMGRDAVEQFYTVMEDFTCNGIGLPMPMNLKPFTMIGATTELGELLKDRKPFVDRFKILIELEEYKPENLAEIANQYKCKTFPDDHVIQENYDILGKNCRLTPRIVIRLLEYLIYLEGDIKKALNNFGIIKDGYTYQDFKLLKYLNNLDRPVGLINIASYLGTSTDNYRFQIEGFLLQREVLAGTPRGRVITKKGKELIKELEKEIG